MSVDNRLFCGAALAHGVAMPIVPEMDAILKAIRGPLADVMSGNQDPATAASAMQKDAQRRIAQLHL